MKILPVLTAALIAATIPASSQDAPPPPPELEAMIQKMTEAGSPNRNHKILDAFVGYWNAESSFWMEGRDKPPMVNRGNAQFAWALGGRFLKLDYRGSFMGGEMVGIGYYGYDNMQKKYTQMWMDNTATAFFPAVGSMDEKGKAITMIGPMDDPATGEMGKTVKYVITMPQNDRFAFEMHDMSITGPDKMVGEIIYTRAAEHR